MTKILSTLFLSVFSFAVFSQATELDPQSVIATELIVKELPNGQKEVFKATSNLNIQNENDAKLAIEKFATEENKVSTVLVLSELDQVSSQEAWFFWYQNWYGFNSFGHTTWYQPYFNFNWGFNNFWYYRSFWW